MSKIVIKINGKINDKVQVFNAKGEVCNYLIKNGVDNDIVYNLKDEIQLTLNNIIDTTINANGYDVTQGSYDWFVDFNKKELTFDAK